MELRGVHVRQLARNPAYLVRDLRDAVADRHDGWATAGVDVARSIVRVHVHAVRPHGDRIPDAKTARKEWIVLRGSHQLVSAPPVSTCHSSVACVGGSANLCTRYSVLPYAPRGRHAATDLGAFSRPRRRRQPDAVHSRGELRMEPRARELRRSLRLLGRTPGAVLGVGLALRRRHRDPLRRSRGRGRRPDARCAVLSRRPLEFRRESASPP